MEKDYDVFVHFVGQDDSLIAVRHTYPGLGRFPTSAWAAGDAFCDNVRLKVEDWAPAPAVYDVEVGLYDRAEDRRLEARDEQGNLISLVRVGRLKIWGAEHASIDPPHPVDFSLDDQIKMIGYGVEPAEVRSGEMITLTLYWQAKRRPHADYTVFVHVLDDAGQVVAQADRQPQGGAYPTSWWEAGDKVEDVAQIVLPVEIADGEYQLVAGMYRLETMERLPVFTREGMPVPGAVTRLTKVRIVR
jgi:hypothetical protein